MRKEISAIKYWGTYGVAMVIFCLLSGWAISFITTAS